MSKPGLRPPGGVGEKKQVEQGPIDAVGLRDAEAMLEPEAFKPGIISVTKWHRLVVGHVRRLNVEGLRGELGPGYDYHGKSVKGLSAIVSSGNGILGVSEGAEGREGVYVTSYRPELQPKDLYLSRGTNSGSVGVMLRISRERLPEKVGSSLHDEGVQNTYYARDVPLDCVDYFDFTQREWKPAPGYAGQFDDLYNIANPRQQATAKKVFRVGGEKGIEYAVERHGDRGRYERIRDNFEQLGFERAEAVQLGFAKMMEAEMISSNRRKAG